MTRSTFIVSIRRVIVPIAVVAVGVVAACSNDGVPLSQPLASPAHAWVPLTAAQLQVLEAQGLMWTTPRQTATSVTQTISRFGGSIVLPGTGLQLMIPNGALSVNTTFTITALAGSVVAYDFAPHGAVFNVPLKLVQNLQGTNFGNIRLPLGFTPAWQGAYFTNELLIDQTTGVSPVQEFIPATVTWAPAGSTSSGLISFPVSHFSGYMISTGRMDEF